MSGAENGAERKSGGAEAGAERGAGVAENDGAEREVAEREGAERERSGERAESAAHSPRRLPNILANVNSRSSSLYVTFAIGLCHRPSICLSSVVCL